MEKYWQNEILDLIPTWREIADKGKQNGIKPASSKSVNVGASVRGAMSKFGKRDMMPYYKHFERREYRPMRDYVLEEGRRETMRRFYENPAFDYLRRRSRYDQPNDMRDFMSDREPRKSFRADAVAMCSAS